MRAGSSLNYDSVLDHEWQSMLPPPEVFRARERTISRVQMAINATFGGTYFLESFGSTRYGVSSATSDLDLVIMVTLPVRFCDVVLH